MWALFCRQRHPWRTLCETLSDGLVFETLCLQLQQLPLEVMGAGPSWQGPWGPGADSREHRVVATPAASLGQRNIFWSLYSTAWQLAGSRPRREGARPLLRKRC